jgi:hypothetical protein
MPLPEAIALIDSVPGYEGIASALSQKRAAGKLRVEAIADRGSASVWGVIRLGPEVMGEGPVAIAATLVHEHFHTTQAPLAKTASFWTGVFTRTPVWRRLERPAYRAAVEFLEALARSRPELATMCAAESDATRTSFEAHYGEPL